MTDNKTDGKATQTITVCAMLGEDRHAQAERCLSSLLPYFQQPLPCVNLRIGLHKANREIRDYVDELQYAGINHAVFESDSNKYALMRQMLYNAPLQSSHVMWFDDTAYCDAMATNVMSAALRMLGSLSLVGQRWSAKLHRDQLAWAKAQPWFTGKDVFAGMPVSFPSGSWWLARAELLQKFDWPAEDAPAGGDMLLGLLMYQQDIRWLSYSNGIRIEDDKASASGIITPNDKRTVTSR